MRILPGLLIILSLAGCAGRQSSTLKSQEAAAAEVNYSGGSGESIEDAVKITGVDNQSAGLDAEYAYVAQKHGLRNKDWRVTNQSVVQEKGKMYELIELELILTKSQRIYYFDVSAFPWKKK
ncbi:MAG: hypothetical protein ACM31E_01110 [Fibrobacterota bacterium]|jgi:hypothetical protein|nr:hypothetical protein [Chitinispirillaceae bacterium]